MAVCFVSHLGLSRGGAQMSGYGCTMAVVQRALDVLGVKEPSTLHEWDEVMRRRRFAGVIVVIAAFVDQAGVHKFIDAFMDVRFPIVLVLNKADAGGETDRNIARICRKCVRVCG